MVLLEAIKLIYRDDNFKAISEFNNGTRVTDPTEIDTNPTLLFLSFIMKVFLFQRNTILVLKVKF